MAATSAPATIKQGHVLHVDSRSSRPCHARTPRSPPRRRDSVETAAACPTSVSRRLPITTPLTGLLSCSNTHLLRLAHLALHPLLFPTPKPYDLDTLPLKYRMAAKSALLKNSQGLRASFHAQEVYNDGEVQEPRRVSVPATTKRRIECVPMPKQHPSSINANIHANRKGCNGWRVRPLFVNLCSFAPLLLRP
ncbi:hypothetical protein BDZ97DRAFT_587681 [Flammula alnicola]|nr:hypothetical protein BDZ97DRAFT_587681 [Flammula alnicola]